MSDVATAQRHIYRRRQELSSREREEYGKLQWELREALPFFCLSPAFTCNSLFERYNKMDVGIYDIDKL
ncbi:hypothetical protein EVAR_2608_1 [Eumeta japonica]|uniref:Uncharacterized protein n=1 Tax=Eumeta variegata TaxID=151549 RepID=A0A4C1SLR5_EUMVA|nr:hypothetical protein EVAR_2608_1 [Eumeta japonica]